MKGKPDARYKARQMRDAIQGRYAMEGKAYAQCKARQMRNARQAR
jgi:hypothetical protein